MNILLAARLGSSPIMTQRSWTKKKNNTDTHEHNIEEQKNKHI